MSSEVCVRHVGQATIATPVAPVKAKMEAEALGRSRATACAAPTMKAVTRALESGGSSAGAVCMLSTSGGDPARDSR